MRLLKPLILIAVLVISSPSIGGSPNDDDLGELSRQIEKLQNAGKYKEALPYVERYTEGIKSRFGENKPEYAVALSNLAVFERASGRLEEAESHIREVIAIDEVLFGRDASELAQDLNSLGVLLDERGQRAEAETLFRRALAIDEVNQGPNSEKVAIRLSNLGTVLTELGRLEEAESVLRRALGIDEVRFGPNDPRVSIRLNNLAALLKETNRLAEAEALMIRALDIDEKHLGPGHPTVAERLDNLAFFYARQGKFALAERLLKRVLTIREDTLGPDHPATATVHNNLAGFYYVTHDWEAALSHARRAAEIITTRAKRASALGRTIADQIGNTEISENREAFEWLISAAWQLSRTAPDRSTHLGEEAFKAAQQVTQSRVAAALNQMAARQAKGGDVLSGLVRERQDLSEEWVVVDEQLISALSEAPDRVAALRKRVAEIEQRLREIGLVLEAEFREYSALTNPSALSLKEARDLLVPHEALVQFAMSGDDLMAWVLTKTHFNWLRLELTEKMLVDQVSGLRCGLDEEEWATATKARRCADLLGLADQPDSSQPLPFHLGKANELYRSLFGEIEPLIKGKRLLIVASGPLTSLPFHVLVTKKPKITVPSTFEGYRDVTWLARSNALTILPSVASLEALRVHASKGLRAPLDYVAYGNPVLSGDGSCRTAKMRDHCPAVGGAGRNEIVGANAPAPGRATIRGRGSRRGVSLDKVFVKGAASEAVLEQVRALCPLPDTAYEIKCVAERFNESSRLIRLDKDATKANIKALSESGTLARYRIVHFATHGLVSGDIQTTAKWQGEPALVLTPPAQPKDSDDNGLLLASEVAQLKLNADWVVLSACNTAAGDKLGGEALSGLARAFFYAQTKALLVSHWPVYSDAAVRLTTGSFAELDRAPKAGRAEALQRAMIDLMGDSSQANNADNAHPAVWAPFILVGEGGE